MRKIEENIFYNIYGAYLKKDYPAIFVSSLYLSFMYIFLFTPLYGCIIDLLYGINKSTAKFLYAVYAITIAFFVFKKYYNKKTLERVLNNNRNKKNYKAWYYFLALPFSMCIGIGLYVIISIYVLKRLNMEGVLYRLFMDFF